MVLPISASVPLWLQQHISQKISRWKTHHGLMKILFALFLVISVLFHATWNTRSELDVVGGESVLLDFHQQQQRLATMQNPVIDRVQHVLAPPKRLLGDLKAREEEQQQSLMNRKKVEPFGILVPPPTSSSDISSTVDNGGEKQQVETPTTQNTAISVNDSKDKEPTQLSSPPELVQPPPKPAPKPFDLDQAVRKYFGKDAPAILKTIPSNCRGKERVIWFLILSGTEIPKDLCLHIPTWNTITEMYGPEPRVENRVCGNLALPTKARDVLAPRLSGPANAGMGMLKRMLKWNIDRIGYKTKLSPKTQLGIASRESLFRQLLHWIIPNDPPKPYLRVILAKDPFAWMQAICRSPSHLLNYPPAGSMEEEMQAALNQSSGQRKEPDPHCPHLVKQLDPETGEPEPYPVQVTSSDELAHKKVESFPSLVQYWNEWFNGYMTKDEPEDGESAQDYIVIRFEDLLFHPLETLAAVGECAGLPVVRKTRKPLTFLTMGNKQLRLAEQSSEFLDRTITAALIFYSNGRSASGLPQRTAGMTELDIRYASKHLDAELLNKLGYRLPHQTSGAGIDRGMQNTTSNSQW